MTTLVYSPGLRITIATARHGVLDVSDDVVRGTVTLRAAGGGGSQGHSLNLTLANERAKYAGVFTPNDRFVVHMKRIRWLQVMSGYLDSVPMFSAYSEDVVLGGQCTLKRLLYSLYDPGAQEVANLLNQQESDVYLTTDSDLGPKIAAVLQQMAGWEPDKIHMGAIPVDWFNEMTNLYRSLEEEGAFTNPPGVGGMIAGAPTGAAGNAIAESGRGLGGAAPTGAAGNAIAESGRGLFGSGSTPVGSSVTASHDGIVWNDREQMSGNTAAARDFVLMNWPANSANSVGVRTIGGYRASGSVATSDHPKGLAIDIMVAAGEPTNEQVALGNSLAWWFCQNPGAFGVKYVIWNNMIYDAAKGARAYIRSDGGQTQVTLGHRDHVHVSFYDTNQTAIGPSGTPFPVKSTDFFTTASRGGSLPQGFRASAIGGPGNVGAIGPAQLVTAWNWKQDGDPLSQALVGSRLLLNDQPVFGLINDLSQASLRQFCSAPNGDFIAWFPDYFNLHGVLSRIVLQTIEIEKFNIQWDDRNLITHSFVTGGGVSGYGAPSAEAAFQERQTLTHGIATIEYQKVLSTLINANPDDPASAGWLSPEAILQRFGARVQNKQLNWAASGEAEFWAAVHQFRTSWAAQFSTRIPISFMPEMFPGMIAQVPAFGIQVYVDEVTHTFDLGPNGGFTTSINAIAPSTLGDQPGLYGLPKGGAWVGPQEQGPAYGPVLDATGGTTSGTKVDYTRRLGRQL